MEAPGELAGDDPGRYEQPDFFNLQYESWNLRRKVFVEFGLGDYRNIGYGPKAELEAGDILVAFDLWTPTGTEYYPGVDDPILPHVYLSRVALHRDVLQAQNEVNNISKRISSGRVTAEDRVRISELEILIASESDVIDSMDEIRFYCEEKQINYLPVYGSGARMPIGEKSADRILFTNLFGNDYITEESKAAFVDQSHLKLRPDGKLVIVESRTSELAAKFLSEHVDPAKWELTVYSAEENPDEWKELRPKYGGLQLNQLGARLYELKPLNQKE